MWYSNVCSSPISADVTLVQSTFRYVQPVISSVEAYVRNHTKLGLASVVSVASHMLWRRFTKASILNSDLTS